jgi:peptidoglycan/xylan/chitin deacetylase (PgdA/CDA1 family)
VKNLVPLLLFSAALQAADVSVPLPNGSFENGLENWTVEAAGAVAAVRPEAALLGDNGLHIEAPASARMAIFSSPVAVQPGKTYTVSLWAATAQGATAGPGTADVKMIFKDAAGKELPPSMARIRKWPGVNLAGSLFPANPLLAAAAPEGAATLTVRLSTSGKASVGPLIFDDFQITELGDEPAQTPARGQANPIPPSHPARLEALEKEIAANPYRGKSPPKIVIKLDDFGESHGGVHEKWRKVADFAKARNIKVTFGIIGKRMVGDCPEFVQWTKDQHAAGRIEFWHHGWDHAERTVDGKRIMEFSGESYEHQKQHFEDTQKLAREKLGFAFVSFGAPFNATDDNTVKVLQEDPDIKVWMYGKAHQPAGKTVLERSFAVNIENPTMIPNYGAFLEGYAHSRGAEYFVLQGHPAAWNDERWEQFVKIVDFLVAQKVEFVFASDLAAKP